MDQNKLNLFKAIYNIEINAYNDAVKAKTGDSTTASVYNNWYKSVYQPADTPAVDEDASAGGQG